MSIILQKTKKEKNEKSFSTQKERALSQFSEKSLIETRSFIYLISKAQDLKTCP